MATSAAPFAVRDACEADGPRLLELRSTSTSPGGVRWTIDPGTDFFACLRAEAEGWTVALAEDERVDVVDQLHEWFAGDRTTFDLTIELDGTDFQRAVWDALQAIPYGETVTYGELAAAAGRPGAARAIGHAVARNPVSIVVPCHRVVGSSGTLTGYAGGIDRKRALLELEQRGGPAIP